MEDEVEPLYDGLTVDEIVDMMTILEDIIEENED